MKRLAKVVFSLFLTALFSWWAFHDTDWQQQWDSIKRAHYIWLIPYFAILLCIHVCRTLRWGCLLSRMEKIPFRKLNEASAIGFMMLILLPFRLGEFARPFLIAERSGVRRSAAMTTVVLERIMDGMAVAVLLRVLLFFVPSTAPNFPLIRFAGNTMFAIFASGLTFLLFGFWHRERAVALVRMTLGRLSSHAAERAAATVDTFVGAVRMHPSRGQAVLFVLYTFVYWGLNGWGMSLLSRAFACSPDAIDCLPFNVSLFQAFVVMCTLVVGVMIPSAPGMVGTFQAAIRVGLSMFLPLAVVTTKGLAYANVAWLCQTAAQVGLGLTFMTLGHLSFREMAGKLESETPASAVPLGSASGAPARRI